MEYREIAWLLIPQRPRRVALALACYAVHPMSTFNRDNSLILSMEMAGLEPVII